VLYSSHPNITSSSPRTDHPLKPDIKRANQPTRNEDKNKIPATKEQTNFPIPTNYLPTQTAKMVQPRMVSQPPPSSNDKPRQSPLKLTGTDAQLTKADEATANDENEVRREDQEKINRFSRLHQRETVLEEQLKGKQVWSSHF
jgi:hypothetical protein